MTKYQINKDYLRSKGFFKNDLTDNPDDRLWIWRDSDRSFWFNLLYVEEQEYLVIKKVLLGLLEDGCPTEITLLGGYQVKSDEELFLIFKRLSDMRWTLNNYNDPVKYPDGFIFNFSE